MSHANIYRYFPSKSALVEGVTDYWLRPIEAGLRDIADGPDPAYDKLERSSRRSSGPTVRSWKAMPIFLTCSPMRPHALPALPDGTGTGYRARSNG